MHDRRSGGICYLEEAFVAQCIIDGRIEAVGNRRAIHELRWLGEHEWKPVTLAAEAAGYKPSERKADKYSFDWETEDNPQNCWTLKHLAATRTIYRRIQTECLAPFYDPDLN